MTKAPFLRRRPSVAFRAARRAGLAPGSRRTEWPLVLLAILALLFAFSEVTLYDLVFHPLDSLKYLAWGTRSLIVTMVDTMPYLLTAVALWLVGVLVWRLLGQRTGTQP